MSKLIATAAKNWVEQRLTSAEQAADVIYKFKHLNNPSIIVVRRQTMKLAEDFNIKTLPETLANTYANEVTNFELVKKGPITIGKYKAVKLTYNRLNYKTKKTYSNAIVVIPMQWQTFYIALNTEEKFFAESEKDLPKLIVTLLDNTFTQ
jgi:hypothetical protein